MGSYLGVSFGRLIEAIYRTHGSVVVLVDEYDKALVNVLDDNATFDCNQATLAPFCGVLKRQDDKIRFGMLTGVSQFAKLNIFLFWGNIATGYFALGWALHSVSLGISSNHHKSQSFR